MGYVVCLVFAGVDVDFAAGFFVGVYFFIDFKGVVFYDFVTGAYNVLSASVVDV